MFSGIEIPQPRKGSVIEVYYSARALGCRYSCTFPVFEAENKREGGYSVSSRHRSEQVTAMRRSASSRRGVSDLVAIVAATLQERLPCCRMVCLAQVAHVVVVVKRLSGWDTV